MHTTITRSPNYAKTRPSPKLSPGELCWMLSTGMCCLISVSYIKSLSSLLFLQWQIIDLEIADSVLQFLSAGQGGTLFFKIKRRNSDWRKECLQGRSINRATRQPSALSWIDRWNILHYVKAPAAAWLSPNDQTVSVLSLLQHWNQHRKKKHTGQVCH